MLGLQLQRALAPSKSRTGPNYLRLQINKEASNREVKYSCIQDVFIVQLLIANDGPDGPKCLLLWRW